MIRQEAVVADREFDFSDRDFERVRDLIHARVGIALADGKRQMVYSRLGRRLRALGLSSFRDYLDHLDSTADEGEEWQSFTNSLTTNLTSFFRESHHFETLSQFLATRRSRGTQHIWSAAVSTGEEAYSLAMVACEALGSDQPDVRIICSDIDTQVLATAECGVYAMERAQRISAERLRRFFERGNGPNAGQVRIKAFLRDLVSFQQINLHAKEYGLRTKFDAIFCRNVMIYFDRPTQREILSRFTRLLQLDGLLFAGHSENFFHASDLFRNCGRTLYQRADFPRVSS